MKPLQRTKLYAALVLGASALVSGCSTLDELTGGGDSVDYKSTVRGDPLNIPPDLTKANANTHYRAPEGTTSYSDFARARDAQSAERASGSGVLPEYDGIQVKRDGQLRWLVVDQPADKVFPAVVEFWRDQGFTIRSEDARAGVVQTDWAENRAKIPESWIRSALGSILDSVFDSGERDRFTSRVERIDGKTEVYISHQHMEESPTTDGAAFKWVYGKEDPNLNAAMLARLMVFLGADVPQAQAKVSEAEQSSSRQSASAVQKLTSGNEAALVINEPFDRAWRRVGVAIDTAGFSVEDRDRSAGEYYIRYLDSDTGEKIEQQNFIGRLFGSRNKAEAQRFRIKVQGQTSDTRVSVLSEQGQTLSDDTAKRIVEVLATNLRN